MSLFLVSGALIGLMCAGLVIARGENGNAEHATTGSGTPKHERENTLPTSWNYHSHSCLTFVCNRNTPRQHQHQQQYTSPNIAIGRRKAYIAKRLQHYLDFFHGAHTELFNVNDYVNRPNGDDELLEALRTHFEQGSKGRPWVLSEGVGEALGGARVMTRAAGRRRLGGRISSGDLRTALVRWRLAQPAGV